MSPLAKIYVCVPPKLRMLRKRMAKLTNELVTLAKHGQRWRSFGQNQKSLDLLKHHIFCLSQKMDARLEAPPCPDVDRKMVIPGMIINLLTLALVWESSLQHTTFPFPDASSLQTLPSLLFHRFVLAWRALSPFLLPYLILWCYFKTQVRNPCSRFVPNSLVFTFRRQTLPLFQEFWIFGPIVCFTLSRWYRHRKLNVLWH